MSEFTSFALQVGKETKNVFKGQNLFKPFMSPYVFGGQMMAQAIYAANNTVGPDLKVHSAHFYFLNKVDNNITVTYEVEQLRASSRFATCAASAKQGDRHVLEMMASYHKDEDLPVKYQVQMDKVVGPEDLQVFSDILKGMLDNQGLPPKSRDLLQTAYNEYAAIPLELRLIDPMIYLTYNSGIREPQPPVHRTWMKARRVNVSGNSRSALCRLVATFMSDWAVIVPAFLPHPNMKVTSTASLDHAIWFHEDFDPEEWILQEIENPKFKNGRCTLLGRLWTREGRLVASYAQEAIFRVEVANKI